jgi:hypothetical protein
LPRYLKLRMGGGACDHRLTHATPRSVDKQLERIHRNIVREKIPPETATLRSRAVIKFLQP